MKTNPEAGEAQNLHQVAEEISRCLSGVFLPDKNGSRPVNAGGQKFQNDPHWRDLVPFYEYFHGDNDAGLGASHQTGWTGIIARALHLFAATDAGQVRELGKLAAMMGIENPATAPVANTRPAPSPRKPKAANPDQ